MNSKSFESMRVCYALAFLTSPDVYHMIELDEYMNPDDKVATLKYLEMSTLFWTLLNKDGARVKASQFPSWKAKLQKVSEYFTNNFAVGKLVRKDVAACIDGICDLFEALFNEYYYQADGVTPKPGWKTEMWLSTKRANQV